MIIYRGFDIDRASEEDIKKSGEKDQEGVMTIEERICIWSLVLLILICIGVGAVPWLGGLTCILALLSIPIIRSLAG